MIYPARDLVNMPRDQLWALERAGKRIEVQFDDGRVTASPQSTIFSAYCWTFYRLFPKAPALMKHHLGDQLFDGKTMERLINTVLWDCWDSYDGMLDREELSHLIAEMRDEIYNDFTYGLETFVQSLNAKDLIEVVTEPEIREINDQIQPNQKSIDSAHRRITKILMDPKKMPHSKIAWGSRAGIYKLGQVLQCVSARGFLTDYDNNIFRRPITRGYIHGFRCIEDVMKDSRSATKSLSFTEEPLQKSQYFNRKLQLLADTITDLVPGDCGTQRYLSWFVTPADLEVLDGKYYVMDGQLRRFQASTAVAEGLIDKTLHFRSILFCDSMHPRGFCEMCYGEMRHSIVRGTNPGHVACTKLGERISQIILSTKHHDHNNSANLFEISAENLRFIKFVEDRNTIMLADAMEGKHLLLTLDSTEAGRLPDVFFVDDINQLQASLVSAIRRAQFTVLGRKGEENVIVPVYSGKRTAMVSREMMSYIKEHPWKQADNGNYTIDLKDWDQDQPLFTLPLKNANMLDYMKTIEDFLAASKIDKAQKNIRQCTTAEEALRELHAIVSTQLKINLVYLETMILSCMVRSAANYDYRLPLPGNTPSFSKLSTLVAARSMAPVLAYQYQRATLAEPQTFLIEHRPYHPLDQLLEIRA